MNSEKITGSDGEVLVRVEGVSKKFCRSLKKSLWYGLCDIGGELNPFRRQVAGVAGTEVLRDGPKANELRVAGVGGGKPLDILQKMHVSSEGGGVSEFGGRRSEARGQRAEGGGSRGFRFERIEAWQLARAFNGSVYRASRGFPKEEAFALTSQIRRASVSVSSNIAEGSGRNSDADFAHFLEIAYGSLMEVISQLCIALDERYLSEADFRAIADEADVLAGKIVSLTKSLGRRPRIAASSSRP